MIFEIYKYSIHTFVFLKYFTQFCFKYQIAAHQTYNMVLHTMYETIYL